jgi:hypothetical protein
MTSEVDMLLRRLVRFKTLRVEDAPISLVAAEDALIQLSLSRLTSEELLQVVERFADYWERSS